MNVSFLQNEPLDTVVINSADGRPLYEVKTPWKMANRVTSISRTEKGGRGQLVAEIHWHRLGSTKITFLGTTMSVDEFLRKGGMLSSSRTFVGTDGRVYKWKHESSSEFTLVDTHTQAVVAESHPHKSGIFSSSQKMNIDIFPQGMHTLDAIIVSFVIIEETRRRTKRGTSAAIAVSAGGTGS